MYCTQVLWWVGGGGGEECGKEEACFAGQFAVKYNLSQKRIAGLKN
jgi:hypothetical protein